MGAFDDIKSSLDVRQLADALGTDPASADAALDTALKSLLGTMEGNVSHEDDAVSLARALGDHVDSDAYADSIDLNRVDTADGEKIVGHVFSPDQIQQLSTSGQGSLIQRLLPILAPIVMGYLAKQFQGYLNDKMAPQSRQAEAPAASEGGFGGLGDLLGGILGGGSAASQSSSGGFGDLLDQVLGGALGGQAPSQPTASREPAAPASGSFRTSGSQSDELRMDPGTGASASQGQTSLPSAGGVLGSLLKDLLGGGR